MLGQVFSVGDVRSLVGLFDGSSLSIAWQQLRRYLSVVITQILFNPIDNSTCLNLFFLNPDLGFIDALRPLAGFWDADVKSGGLEKEITKQKNNS